MVTIYALIDPNTEQIKYVGKTIHCPKKRLQAHLYEKQKTHKCNWIKSLNGKIPELLILDTVDENNWIFWEQYWISQCKTWGFKLTNTTIGGEGGSGMKHSEERKQQISNFLLGRVISQETRNKINKPILQYNLEGNFIREWKSATEVKNILGLKNSEITAVCKGRQKTSYNFIWRYKNDPLNKKFILKYKNNNKAISQYDKHGKLINSFKSIKEASNYLKIGSSGIVECCKKRFKKYYGFIWRYKEDEDTNININKEGKRVIQYDLESNFIKEWKTLKEIEDNIGFKSSAISNCCRGISKTSYNYIWKFK